MAAAVNNNELLELKFEGNGVNPSIVKPSEIATLITEFESALLSTIKNENPEINTDELLFSFDSLKNESIGINFSLNKGETKIKSEISKVVVASYLMLNTAISTANYSALPEKAVTSIKKIQQFSKKYDCTASFKHNGIYLSRIDAKTEIRVEEEKNGVLKGLTTIYGELSDAGGDKPNIHIKIDNGYSIIINADKNKVKELASRLYDFVGLKGEAEWDISTSRIKEFKLLEVLDYNPKKVVDTFGELKNLFGDGWEKYNTNDEINKQLLRE